MKKNYFYTLIVLLLSLIITTVVNVDVYRTNNTEEYRTLYYYGNDIEFDDDTMDDITTGLLGVSIDNYIFESYTLIDSLKSGDYPEELSEVIVTDNYCRTIQVDTDGTTTTEYSCSDDIIGQTLTIDETEYTIVGIYGERYVSSDPYKYLKQSIDDNTDYVTLLVSDETIETLSSKTEYYEKIIFKKYSDLLDFVDTANNDVYYNEGKSGGIYLIILYIVNVILIIDFIWEMYKYKKN